MKRAAAILAVYLSFASLAFAAQAPEGREALQEGHADAAAHHAAEHAAGHGSGGLPQFDPTWFPSQVFWLAVAFAVMYFFFARKTLPEISSVIENRRNHIRADLESAEKLTAQAEAVQSTYEKILDQARARSAALVSDIEQDIKKKAATEYAAFQKYSETEIQAAEDRIRQAKSQAMGEMNTIAAEVASQAVEKIIGVGTDLKEAKSVVESMQNRAEAA